MDSLSIDMAGGHTGGRQHRNLRSGGIAEIVEQGGFTCARPTGNEGAPVAVLHDIEGVPELFVNFYLGLFMFRICHRQSTIKH